MTENRQACETVIVGGGIAGLTCALHLRNAGKPFVLVSENIGGRICYLSEYDMNFGAVFFMQGYTHAKEFLTAGKPVLSSYFDLECHLSLGRGYGVLSSEILGCVPGVLGYLKYLKSTFKPHYEAFKLACETEEVIDAMEADPYIQQLFNTNADEFLASNRFEKAARVLVSQFVYACTGSPISTLNALDYLNCSLGLIDDATRFSFNPVEVQQQLTSEVSTVVSGTATSVGRGSCKRWKVELEDGSWLEADNLVLATPADVTQQLLEETQGVYAIREASELHAYKVTGNIREEYSHHGLHLFDQSIPLINIGARPDGAYEVFTCKELDMSMFFEEYEVVHQQDWPRALFTHPSIVLKQDLGEGLYRIGDHNALGLEPAAISGVFAANRILSA